MRCKGRGAWVICSEMHKMMQKHSLEDKSLFITVVAHSDKGKFPNVLPLDTDFAPSYVKRPEENIVWGLNMDHFFHDGIDVRETGKITFLDWVILTFYSRLLQDQIG